MAFSLFRRSSTENKKVAKWSPDEQKLQVDFFCHLTYMAAMATSGISPRGLFHYAADLPYISAHYFIRVNVVARAFNHHYSEACRIVGETTEDSDIKGFLLRLASAISSGEDLAEFLAKEAHVASENYTNYYEGSLETLKKWTDAYLSLIMAAAIIAVMGVVTMIIGNISVMFNLAMGTIVTLATIAGVYMINKAAPREERPHKLQIRSSERILMSKLLRTVLPAGIIVIAALIILKMSLSWIFIAIGLALAILSPIAVTLIQLAISRKREYLADASGALLTRYPDGLADALQKISLYSQPMKTANNATAHLFIANPFGGKKISNLFSTHPPIEKRIEILRNMAA